jgi:hypothetical protein
MNTFTEHDRAVEASPERQQLTAALSRLTKATYAHDRTRTALRQVQAEPSHRLDSNHERTLHRDRIDAAQRAYDEAVHDLAAAKGESDQLRRVCVTQRLDGRVEAHRQVTADLIDPMRMLRDAVIADREFRDQLQKDLLPFRLPLRAIRPYDGGGPAWIDQMLPVLDDWIAKIERTDAYGLASKTPAKQPRLQIA